MVECKRGTILHRSVLRKFRVCGRRSAVRILFEGKYEKLGSRVLRLGGMVEISSIDHGARQFSLRPMRTPGEDRASQSVFDGGEHKRSRRFPQHGARGNALQEVSRRGASFGRSGGGRTIFRRGGESRQKGVRHEI